VKHKSFGTITNVTKIHPTSGKRDRISGSGNLVVDVVCEDGQQRTLLLDSKYWDSK